VFIPERFQFPFLNIKKIDLDNFLTPYTDSDILRDAPDTGTQVILVAVST
jgi:hypothetical protein